MALRVSLLESVPLHDLPSPRALILAIKPETENLFTDETQWPRVFAAIATNSVSLETDAATVLRATAWYPPDVHLCALAQLAKAFAMRDARIDGELRTVLLERIHN